MAEARPPFLLHPCSARLPCPCLTPPPARIAQDFLDRAPPGSQLKCRPHPIRGPLPLPLRLPLLLLLLLPSSRFPRGRPFLPLTAYGGGSAWTWACRCGLHHWLTRETGKDKKVLDICCAILEEQLDKGTPEDMLLLLRVFQRLVTAKGLYSILPKYSFKQFIQAATSKETRYYHLHEPPFFSCATRHSGSCTRPSPYSS
jgi:hypothetical protein